MNQENQHMEDRAMRSLQEELNRMAAETPEMPESFRQGWREAIRQEAKEKETERLSEKNGQQEETEHRPAKSEKQEKETSKVIEMKPARGFSAKWRRGLSIAAVAAFLLGGTLLGQVRASLTQVPQSETVSAAMDTVSEESAAEDQENEPAYVLLESASEAVNATQTPMATGLPAMEAEQVYETEVTADAGDADETVETNGAAMSAELTSRKAVEEGKTEAVESEKSDESTSLLRIIGWVLIGLSLVCLILLFTFRK